MLQKSKRLNLKKDFKWVASGKKIESKFLTLFAKMGDNTAPRVGIAISSKFFKKAHERSRAKRLASAAFETAYNQLPASINIAALPKRHILKVKSQDVVLDLEKVIKDEKIIS